MVVVMSRVSCDCVAGENGDGSNGSGDSDDGCVGNASSQV